MAKFNAKSAGTKTVNLAGGKAYKQTTEVALVSHLLTSFVGDQFYRTQEQGLADLDALIGGLADKKFAAQAVVFARQEFGMRSVSHAAAALLAKHTSGQPWAKSFYRAVIHRPDDIAEILSFYFDVLGNKTLPKAMQKGLAAAFAQFNGYQLAKYRGEGKGIKLVDAVNILHPKPVEGNAEALKALVEGKLTSTDTWEAELTKAGQKATTDDEKAEFKKDVWVKLIQTRKLGYFALLRNLRNIIEQAPGIVPDALTMLTDETLIRKSLVLPFRYLTACNVIQEMAGQQKVMAAISKAVDIAVANAPEFPGQTLIALDVSGSMKGVGNWQGNAFSDPKAPVLIGGLFAAILGKKSDADILLFDGRARWFSYNPADSALSIAKALFAEATGGSTDFHLIFDTAQKPYDRVVIFSDMQGWAGGYSTPTANLNAYKKRTGADPFVYSFDLQGYGTMQFPQGNGKVFCVAGFSEKAFDILKLCEQDKNALVNRVKKVEF